MLVARVPTPLKKGVTVQIQPKVRRGHLAFVTGALMMVATACGADSGEKAATGGAFPTVVKAANGEVTVPAKPQRIVSLSPTATEMLFAIGAGPQVVAVDDQSTYPAEAPKTALSGFTPNTEAIVGYRPDLVVISNDTNGLAAALGRVNVPVLLEPAAKNFDEVYAQVRALGVATGNTEKANAAAADMQKQIDAMLPPLPAARPAPTTKVYHEVDPTLYSVTSQTFVGQIYQRMNLVNVADAADKDGSGYPQLSAEYLIQANPDVIFLADTKFGGQSSQTVAQRPGFTNIKAVKTGNVVPLDDDIASRWGPRLVDLVRVMTEGTKKAQAA